jgi:glycerol-3-phosphate dehydrogenase
VDHVRTLDTPGVAPVSRPTKGVHVVVERARIGHERALLLRSPRDGRVVFVLPWGEESIVGPTDTVFSGDPGSVSADASDIAYLLEAVNGRFPMAKLVPADVHSTFAGVRPLVAPADPTLGASQISREEEIFVSPSGLLTLAGGKLTTFRQVGATVVDRALEQLGENPRKRPSRSAERPLHVARGAACVGHADTREAALGRLGSAPLPGHGTSANGGSWSGRAGNT